MIPRSRGTTTAAHSQADGERLQFSEEIQISGICWHLATPTAPPKVAQRPHFTILSPTPSAQAKMKQSTAIENPTILLYITHKI